MYVQLSGTFLEGACMFKTKTWLRKQSMDWRRVVVSRVWCCAGKEFAIKYQPVERDEVLLLKHIYKPGVIR